MKLSNISIVLIWSYFIVGGLAQGSSMDRSPVAEGISSFEQICILWVFPFVFFIPAVFFQRKTVLKFRFLAGYIDNKHGPGTLDGFVARLRPTLLFMTGILSLGVSGLWATYFNGGPDGGYIVSGFFVSGGAGVLVAYLLSLKFPPVVS